MSTTVCERKTCNDNDNVTSENVYIVGAVPKNLKDHHVQFSILISKMNVWTLIRTHIDVVTIGRIGLSQSAWGQVSQYILIPITGFPLLVSFPNPLALEAKTLLQQYASILSRIIVKLWFSLPIILQQSAEKEETFVKKKSKGCIQSGFFPLVLCNFLNDVFP